MTTSFIYLNLASSVLATMATAEFHPVFSVACILWMGLSAYLAHRAGLLDE